MSEAQRPQTDWRSHIESIRAAGLAGFAFVALTVTSLVLVRDQPGAGSSQKAIEQFYSDGGGFGAVLIGLNLAPFAAIAFLWFIAAIRRQVGDREDRFFSTVFIGSGLLYLASYLAAAILGAAPALAVQFADAQVPSAEAIGISHGTGWGFFSVVGIRFAGVFMIVVSTIGRRTGALARWLVVIGFVFAIILLATATISSPVGALFAVWVALVSVELIWRRRSIEEASK